MRSLPSEDARDQVRSRLNLVDVVQQHVRLRRQGRELVGLCPFHQEKTPSFSVSEQKQSWYCFGCEKGGDMFDFVQLIEKVDFPAALRILAETAGVEVAERSGPARERAQLRRRLVELNRLAAQYYEYVLHVRPAGEPGRQLLERRQVGEATARRFGLGYAPGGSSFATFLRKRGHAMGDAIQAGLVRRGGQDYFQQRLMVPIRDERGQPVAFTGRTVLPEEVRKYVNTPETAAYVKGRVLFALDLARPEIDSRGHAVLMEGQFDVIVGHQFGVGNAVASSGTALTAEQMVLLRRFTDEVVLMFDNDRAGWGAAEKAVVLAQDHQVRTRVARIPGEAKDPDEFLRSGGSWEDVEREARPGWEVMLRDTIAGLNSHSPADRTIGIGRVRSVLRQIKDEAERDTYCELAGRLFDVEPKLIAANLAEPAPRQADARRAELPDAGLAGAAGGNKLSNSVVYLLRALAVFPQAVEHVRTELDPADLGEDDREAFLRVLSALERADGVDGLPLVEANMVRRAWALPTPGVSDEMIDGLLRRIRRESLTRRRRVIIRGLAEAERRRDRDQVAALELQLRELSERI